MKKTTIFAASCLLGMITGQAATIAWTSATYTTSGAFGENLDAGQFDTTGSLLLAENTGGAAETFDGINFAAGSISLGNVNPPNIDPLGYHQGTPVGNSDIARYGSYSGGSSASNISIAGLTVGEPYRIQLLIYDGLSSSIGRTVEVDAQDQGVYANGIFNVTWGPGMLVTGVFTADAVSQDFTIETFDGATSMGGQLNAILVHQVPEPSAVWLAGCGWLSILRRRR